MSLHSNVTSLDMLSSKTAQEGKIFCIKAYISFHENLRSEAGRGSEILVTFADFFYQNLLLVFLNLLCSKGKMNLFPLKELQKYQQISPEI